jgi:MFS family permease
MATKMFHEPAPNPVLEKKILNKVGWRLMPVLLLGMFISYVDRANLGVLSKPMSQDLGLTSAAFGLSAGLFYIGYLLFEIPSNMAMVKFGARIWIARIMVSWGLVTVLMALIQNELSLHLLRILLGAAEAGFYPGVILFLTFWFPQRVAGRAFSLLQIAIPVSLALANVLTSSLLGLDGVAGLDGWRWVFILQGIPAVALGIYIFFVLPERPSKAKWLNANERTYLEEQVSEQIDEASHDIKHLPTVLKNPVAWVFSLLYFCTVIGFWSLTYFLPQVVQERFKVGAVESGFISALPWIFTAAAVVFVLWSTARTGDRKWHMFVSLMLAGAGLFLAAYTDSPWIALVGLSLGAAGMQAVSPVFWTMPSTIFAGATAAIAIAMINSLGNLSGLAGPWLLGILKDATGSTQSGLAIMAVFFVVAAILAFAMSNYTDRWVLRNREATGQKVEPSQDQTAV